MGTKFPLSLSQVCVNVINTVVRLFSAKKKSYKDKTKK